MDEYDLTGMTELDFSDDMDHFAIRARSLELVLGALGNSGFALDTDGVLLSANKFYKFIITDPYIGTNTNYN